MDDLDMVKDLLKKTYHSRAVDFPFGVRLRFVPWISFNNRKRIQDIMDLRRRQDAFISTVIHMASWELTGIDRKKGALTSTLRELILNLKSQEHPRKPLFLSVDVAWNNPGVHVFAFMPRMETEARHAVTTLYPLLQHHHGNDVELYFSNAAVNRAQGCAWDEDKQQIMTKDELYFDNLRDTIDADDDWFGFHAPATNQTSIVNLTPTSVPTLSSARVENVFYGDAKDSIGTIKTTATDTSRHRITGEVHLDDQSQDKASLPNGQGSISGITVDTRVSVIEEQLHKMASSILHFQQEVTTSFDSLHRMHAYAEQPTPMTTDSPKQSPIGTLRTEADPPS
jgi:hypothetical protein